MPLACLLFLPFVRLIDFHFFFPFQHLLRLLRVCSCSLCALPASSSQQAADWLECERTSCSTVFWPNFGRGGCDSLSVDPPLSLNRPRRPRRVRAPSHRYSLSSSSLQQARSGDTEMGKVTLCASANEWTCQRADCRGSTRALPGC
eukprot:scaffold5986_cov128-Isochrysis_galbana.AAC.4